MKNKHLKPIIISTLVALSFSGAAVGTSFALFTDRADTKINVTAGIVDIETSVRLVHYENTGNLTNESKDFTGEVSYENEIGTKFYIDDHNDFQIKKMVPGDKVQLAVKLFNNSNVETKYRLVVSKTGNLVPALKVTSTGANTKWTALEANTSGTPKEVCEEIIEIEFVNHDQGQYLAKDDETAIDNKYMDATATYSLSFQVVQANANLPEIESEGLDGYKESFTPAEDYSFVGDVAGLAKFSGYALDKTKPVTAEVAKTTTAGNFTFGDGENVVSYDLHLENYNGNNDGVAVELYIGKGFEHVYLVHETSTGNENLSVVYDKTTGVAKFNTNSFSTFNFVTSMTANPVIKTEAQLKKALTEIETVNVIYGSRKLVLGDNIALTEDIKYENDNALTIELGDYNLTGEKHILLLWQGGAYTDKLTSVFSTTYDHEVVKYALTDANWYSFYRSSYEWFDELRLVGLGDKWEYANGVAGELIIAANGDRILTFEVRDMKEWTHLQFMSENETSGTWIGRSNLDSDYGQMLYAGTNNDIVINEGYGDRNYRFTLTCRPSDDSIKIKIDTFIEAGGDSMVEEGEDN